MIDPYIQNWLDIIENMKNTNTYKLSWGRAILECLSFSDYQKEDNQIVVSFKSIASCMLKHYWNQGFFFNLRQGPIVLGEETKGKPLIEQETEKLINNYKSHYGNTPVWFDIARKELEQFQDYSYENCVDNIASILTHDVSYRFLTQNGKTIPLYSYTKGTKQIIFTIRQVELLKEYNLLLSELLNYRWSQLLEKFNFAPKISSKVKGVSDNIIKRNSLSKFRDILMEEYPLNKPVDFYSNHILTSSNISVDHVIPWSFMYSDDIWNLVSTSKSINSLKSNHAPTKEDIQRLKERNLMLAKTIKEKDYRNELLFANQNDLVDRYYREFQL